jgi:predicted acyltransferase
MAAESPSAHRILSLDQFRGYTIAGMFAVNFLGDYWRHWPALFTLRHHNDHFSYADSIMPQFLFAVGFAYRLTILKRIQSVGERIAARQAVIRGLSLVLLSLVLFPPFQEFKSWSALQEAGWAKLISNVIKGDLWETLAIIGVTSIWVLPVISRSAGTRLAFLFGCAAAHVAIAQAFNFHSIAGKPNALDALWPLAAGKTSFDGGPFGFLAWSIPMLVGSLAYDAVAAGTRRACWRMFGWAAALMAAGYALSCGTMLYVRNADGSPVAKPEIASSPVIPYAANLEGRALQSLLSEPPFTPPRPAPVRLQNYWTMCKRQTSLSFMTFASGFALAVYAAFGYLADVRGLSLPLFTTFGQNALVAYVIHELTMKLFRPLAPEDAPHAWIAIVFGAFFFVTWMFLRYLEKGRIFLKL